MNMQKPTRSDRAEGVARGMLALALIAALAWAVADGNGAHQKFADLSSQSQPHS